MNVLTNFTRTNITLSFLVLTTIITLNSCGGSKKKGAKKSIAIHELSDPDMLNPTNYASAGAGYIVGNIFQSLIGIDFKSLEFVPILAKNLPVIEELENGKLLFHYELRPEAKWDNGDPIVAEDVAFSLKVIKNPSVDCQSRRPYFEFIEDVIFDSVNDKKFTLVFSEKYVLAEGISGDFSILPRYVYDPENLMGKFTVKELNEAGSELTSDPNIAKFAKEYNSPKFQREKDYIVGSGPYRYEKWETGQRIVLTKKENWWGSTLRGENMYFDINASILVHETINDVSTATTALKAQKIDIMKGIPPKNFIELQESDKFKRIYNSFTPPAMVYHYLGINTKLPKFADIKVRKALAHLVDVNKIIKTVEYGMGERVVGPVHPSKKAAYNDTITPYDFNIEKAKNLLKAAGWRDNDGNGVLDKMIEGEFVEFNIEFTFNSGNDRRKSTALIFQEVARKVGINVNVIPVEWSVYLENQKKHDFEMYYGAWIGSPTPNDHKQIYHTSSTLGGSNYVYFGNSETDKLIENMRVELDEEKRNHLERKLQEYLHDYVSYIFLFAPTERIAINKRYINAEGYVMRPGFYAPGLKQAQSAS